MGETFAKIKKQRTLFAALKIAVCAVTCGLIAVGAVLLALKLAAVPLAAGWYVLIGFGAALVAGGISAPVLLFSEKKLARELDREYALNERAQTALAFRDADGAIVRRQREDAEEKLASLPRRKIGFSKIWGYVLLCVLAPAIAITAFALPAKSVSGTEDHSKLPFSVSEFQLIAVRELIENVNDSQLSDPLKQGASAELSALLAELPSATTVGEMETLVFAAIGGVNDVLRASCTYRELSVRLGEERETACVRAMRRSVLIYERYDFPNYDNVQMFAETVFGEVRTQVNIELNRIFLEVGADEDGFSEGVSRHAEGIAAALLVSEAPAEDRIRAALNSFALSLKEIADEYDLSNTTFDEARGNVQGLLVEMGSTLGVPLSAQAYTLGVNKYVSQKLRDVFGLPAWEHDPADDFNDGYEDSTDASDGDPSGGDGDDEDGSGGGYGEGDTIYGSNDLIYDPDSGKYVEYGELMNRYYAILQEYLENGSLTPEQEATARAYFDILFSGF